MDQKCFRFGVLGAVVNTALAVNTLLWSTRLCRSEVFSLHGNVFLLMYSYTALVLLRCARDDFALLIVVDTRPTSTGMCRPQVLSLQLAMLLYIYSLRG